MNRANISKTGSLKQGRGGSQAILPIVDGAKLRLSWLSQGFSPEAINTSFGVGLVKVLTAPRKED
jgi:hypothetical protein